MAKGQRRCIQRGSTRLASACHFTVIAVQALKQRAIVRNADPAPRDLRERFGAMQGFMDVRGGTAQGLAQARHQIFPSSAWRNWSAV